MSTALFAMIGHKFKPFLPKISLESWLFAGSAVGLTVAFHAPLSGLIMTLEKLVKLKAKNFKNIRTWLVEKLIKLKSPNFKNTIIWSCLALISYAAFHETGPMFFPSDFFFELSSLTYIITIYTAVICGLLAVMFKATKCYLHDKIAAIKSHWWHIMPIVAGLLVATISFYGGVYSFNGGMFTTHEALVNSEILLSSPDVIARIANTIITFASGCAGGIIAPALAIGSGIGSVLSAITVHIDTNVFILIGMAAFLSTIFGEPITSAIIVFETTGQSVEILPLLLCASFISLYSLRIIEKLMEYIPIPQFLKNDPKSGEI